MENTVQATPKITLKKAQQLARDHGFIINRRGSIRYWLKLVASVASES